MSDKALPELVQALIDAREAYKEANARAKELKAEYDRLSIEVLPSAMQEANFDSVSVGDQVVYLRTDLRANVLSNQRGALAAELREIGEGDIITEYVFPQTLTAWVRDRLDRGEPVPSVIDLSSVTRAVPRKK